MFVCLCVGGCSVGGVMSWGEFKMLVFFVEGSFFYGLLLFDDVCVIV